MLFSVLCKNNSIPQLHFHELHCRQDEEEAIRLDVQQQKPWPLSPGSYVTKTRNKEKLIHDAKI